MRNPKNIKEGDLVKFRINHWGKPETFYGTVVERYPNGKYKLVHGDSYYIANEKDIVSR